MVQRVKCFTVTLSNVIHSLQLKTYHMIRKLVSNYALAIFISKKADRSNNVQVQNAGRYKFSELFYGFDQPIYQEIEYRDLLQIVIMPKEIKELRDKNMTYSQSSKEKKTSGSRFHSRK